MRRILIISMMLALASFLVACPKNTKPKTEETVAAQTDPVVIEQQNSINKVKSSLEFADYPAARAEAAKFMQNYPAHESAPDMQYIIATSYLREGSEEKARAEFEKLVKNYPQSSHTAEAAETLRALETRRLQEIAAMHAERQRVAIERANKIQETTKEMRIGASKERVYIVLDLLHNVVMLKMGSATLYAFPVASGKGVTTVGGKLHQFVTPIGHHTVKTKNVDPIWVRPNWYWTEQGKEVPEGLTGEDRSMGDHLGAFSVGIGDMVYFHGYAGSVKPGKYTHGCVRMNKDDLDIFYSIVEVGTDVYIF